jgi:hypothetical protein
LSFDDFFVKGLRDAERRLPLLRPIQPDDQEAILTVARSSMTFRFIDRLVERIGRACETSIIVNLIGGTWAGMTTAQQRLLIGVGLIVASLVNVGLVGWHEAPPSWLWLVLPALAIALGILFLMFASTDREEHG